MAYTIYTYISVVTLVNSQNHLGRHSEGGRKIRQTKEEVGRRHQGMNAPGVSEGHGE